jgi:xanthine/CO dehydrogenase XdhC/CoxF family maturation factor
MLAVNATSGQVACAVGGMNRREAERFVTALRDARLAGSRTVMATVVRVQGHGYRHAGTRLLVRDDGRVEGGRWPGPVERAIAIDAVPVIETGDPMLITYDLADESPAGLGIGCPGTIDILLERTDDEPVTNAWLTALERGDVAALMTPLSGVTGRRLLYESGHGLGHLDDPAIQQLADDRVLALLRGQRRSCFIEDVGGAEVLFDIGSPPTELVIFGDGYDAEVLSRQACWLGFVVMVVDTRGGFLDPDRFPGAKVIFAPSHLLDQSIVIADGTFIVVMNHRLERDRDALRFSLESPAGYIGVVGPPSRLRRLLSGLAAEGYTPDRTKLARVRSPVGLATGAETPEEVAMAIAAEILAVERGFSGGFLNGLEQPLHESTHTDVTVTRFAAPTPDRPAPHDGPGARPQDIRP